MREAVKCNRDTIWEDRWIINKCHVGKNNMEKCIDNNPNINRTIINNQIRNTLLKLHINKVKIKIKWCLININLIKKHL